MAVTLEDLAKVEIEPLRKGVIMNLLRYSPLLGKLPFENVNSLRSIAVRWTQLPTVGFRRINEGYTPSEGTVDQVQESVYAFGGEVKFDRVFDKVGNVIVDQRVLQTQMKLKALSFTFNEYFIEGDHATDADGFEGIKKRIANMPSRQTINLATTTDALDPTASAANARLFLDKWDEAVYKTNGGNVSAILCNEGVRWGFARVLRYLSANGGPLLDVTKDAFDRDILAYKGAPLFDMGLRRDQSTEVIVVTDTVSIAGGATNATTVYFLSYGMEDGISGIQLSPMDVYDPLNGGEQETTPTKLLRIDWWLGLANFGSYGLTRVRDLEDPASWT